MKNDDAMLLRLVATLLVLAAVAAGEHLLPEAAYQVSDGNSLYVIAPAVALTADAALAVLSTPTLEACAAACRLDRLCTAFEHCDVQVCVSRGCPGCWSCRRRSRRAASLHARCRLGLSLPAGCDTRRRMAAFGLHPA